MTVTYCLGSGCTWLRASGLLSGVEPVEQEWRVEPPVNRRQGDRALRNRSIRLLRTSQSRIGTPAVIAKTSSTRASSLR